MRLGYEEKNLAMIEIRHLRLIRALAETGNLSKAARAVNLSQPAASRQMSDVESHYGSLLFERKTDPLKLTPAGNRLLDTAFSILGEVDSAERDLARIREGKAGALRIAVECHSCFDWLMPSMDRFRESWPEVEMDLVSGFQPDPVGLLSEDQADLVIVSRATPRAGIAYHPLFRYEVLALLAHGHRLCAKDYLTARDFARETLVTYPIPDDRIDVIREVLKPAGVEPARRTTELTVAILQLVASQRAVAAMPGWAVQPYLDRDYIASRPIRKNRLQANLYAATTANAAGLAYMAEFLGTMRRVSFRELRGIEAID